MLKLYDVRVVALGLLFAVALGLGVGSWITHKVDHGAYADLELKVSSAQKLAKDAADKLAESDRKAGDAIAAKTAAENRLAQQTFNDIRKGNTYVEKQIRAQGVPAHVLPAGWVRQYNAGLSAGIGQAPAAAGGTDAAASGAGAAESGEDLAAPSGITEWDVLDNATDNAEGYASCRRQLNSLIDWVEATTTE